MEEIIPTQSPNSENLTTENINQNAISDLIKKVGAFGLYQKISLVLLFIAACVCGQYTTITPFLFFQDQYQCTLIPSNFSSCLDYVCSLPLEQRYQHLPIASMQTLANKFGDYRCSNQSNVINISILIMYVGLIVSYLFMSIFGDHLGRKTFVIIGAISCIAGTLFAILINNIYLASVGSLFGTFGIQIVFGISFTIVSQIVAEQYRENCMVVLQIFYSIGHLIDTGFYFWLRDWQQIFIYVFMIPMAVFLVCYLIIAVDTPIVLVKNFTPQDAIKQFLWIARVNGVQQVQITKEQLAKMKQLQETRQTEQQKASKFTILDIFRYPSLRWMTVALIVVQISITFLYFAPNLMLDQFQLSIFINGLVYGSATVIATAIMYFPINIFPRKYVAVTTLSITLICSFVLIFVYHTKSQGQNLSLQSNIGILVAIFIIMFSITAEYTFFLVYLTQLYPTQVRVLGISLVSLTSAIILSVSSFIIDGAINSGFSVMIVFSIFAAAGLIASLCLPETLQKKQSDFVQQLQVKMSRRTSQREKEIPVSQPQSERGLNKVTSAQNR